MLTGKILLDTNIVIALFAGENIVQQRLAEGRAVFIPTTVLGELYYGAYKSTNAAKNLSTIEELIANSAILSCDTITALRYGEIKNQLRTKGSPIPENDIWIAAIALQHQLTLITRDAHFKEINDLVIETW